MNGKEEIVFRQINNIEARMNSSWYDPKYLNVVSGRPRFFYGDYNLSYQDVCFAKKLPPKRNSPTENFMSMIVSVNNCPLCFMWFSTKIDLLRHLGNNFSESKCIRKHYWLDLVDCPSGRRECQVPRLFLIRGNHNVRKCCFYK